VPHATLPVTALKSPELQQRVAASDPWTISCTVATLCIHVRLDCRDHFAATRSDCNRISVIVHSRRVLVEVPAEIGGAMSIPQPAWSLPAGVPPSPACAP